MSRKPMGEKAMTNTERSRRRLEREAETLAMLHATLKESATQLLTAAKTLAELGQTIAANECIAKAERAMNAANGDPDAPPIIAAPESPQRAFERQRAERRAGIHARYARHAGGA